MQVMLGNVGCRLCEERERDWELIQMLSQCLDIIAAKMDKDTLLWSELFIKLNGVMVRLENKWREIGVQ